MVGVLEGFNGRAGLRVLLLSLMLAAVIASVSCSRPGGSPSEEAAGATTSAVEDTTVREVPVAGSLVFPNSESLSFESAGVVGDVLVNEGQQVSSGQVLVSLDSYRIAQLEIAVSQAQTRLASAESDLNALRVSNPTLTAEAELRVADSEVAVDQAQQALDDLIQTPTLSVVGAGQAVARAAVVLDDAQEDLDDLLTPKEIAVSAAEKRVAAARVELDNAQEAYDDIKDGAYPDDVVRDARNRVSFATTALALATSGATDSELAQDNALKQASDAQDLLLEEYEGLFKYWFGTEPTDAELLMPPKEMFAEWGIDLDATFDRRNPTYISLVPTPDDPATRWNEITIWAWLNLYPEYGAVVPTCEDSERFRERQVCVMREFENAFDVLDNARDRYATALNTATTSTESTQDAVASAQAALADAQDDLAEVEDGPDASQVEDAEKRLRLAKASLQESEEDLAELTVRIDPLIVEQARASLALAEADFQEANKNLERALDNSLHIESARKQLDLANAALAEAKVRLDDSRSILREQISLAETEVELAKEALAEAMDDRDGAVIRSPLDGVISLVNVEVDDQVGDKLSVVEVTAADVVEVDGVIDAASRAYVNEGASAVVNIASIDGASLTGRVTFVGDEIRTERGVVSFAVRIRVDVPDGVDIPITMSAVSAVIMVDGAAMLSDPGESDATPNKPVS